MKKNALLLRNNLSQFKNIFQYVQKKIEHLGKNPQNYENNHVETCVFEQKPIKIDDFNEAEEKEVKERIKKGKRKEARWLKKTGF